MDGYDASTWGERRADVYDEAVAKPESEPTLSALVELARGGRVLELGVGTGRLAVPLAQSGLEVVGVDASSSMLERLAVNAAGLGVTGVLGDFADVDVAGTFSLAFVAFNTFFLLSSQDAQRRCFRNVAARLSPDGVFAIEVFIAYDVMSKFESLAVHEVSTDHVLLNVLRHDPSEQLVNMQEIRITEEGVKLYPSVFRYSWPSELDLLAELEGLRLRDRWENWEREPYGPRSRTHVSVYELAN
jgi:SAM-dependent methyltransferase